MKNLIFILIFNFLALNFIAAQAPQSFKYQGVARNNGTLVVGGVGVQLTILQGSPTGTIMFQERHFPNTNAFGVFSIDVGTGTVTQGNWNSINWSTGAYYIQTEIDPGGGASYTNVGTSQLLSVPFALYGEDADANPTNEIQQLTYSGNTLSLSQGGGAVAISTGADADADPTNELQSLNISGSTLSLTNSNSVDLQDIVAGTAPPWQGDVNVAHHFGNVGIGTNNPAFPLSVEKFSATPEPAISGVYAGSTAVHAIGVRGYSRPVDWHGIGGFFEGGWKGLEGTVNATGGEDYYGIQGSAFGGSGDNYGTFGIADGGAKNFGIYGFAEGQGENYGVFGRSEGGDMNYAGYFRGKTHVTQKFTVGVNEQNTIDVKPTGAGSIRLNGPNGQANLVLSDQDGASNHGKIDLLNSAGESKINIAVLSQDVGWMAMHGPNGNFNSTLSSITENANHGNFALYDSNGNAKVGMYVDPNGVGVIYKDMDNFRMDHPEKEGKEIWYACIEGPEAAAYERGTFQLENGTATINFSDHFKIVGNMETATVILTPMSTNTYGLAVIEITDSGFTVGELMNGTGDFKFQWEVKAVRKGYENYRVIRDKSEMQIAKSDHSNTSQQLTPTKLDFQKDIRAKKEK